MSRSYEGSQHHLASSKTRGLLLGFVYVAAVFNGMLASGINRTLVDMPAWQRVGAPTWARSAAVPIYAAALLALGGMLATTRAAPTLLATRQISDPAALQRALNRFAFWGGVRAVFQFLAFCANLWSLVAISRR